MALDDLLEESSSTLAWEQLFFDPSLYPAADEQTRICDNVGLHPFSRSEATVPFHRTRHPEVTGSAPLCSQGTDASGLSLSLSNNVNHYPPLQMPDTTMPFYDQPILPHLPSPQTTLSEVFTTRYSMPYPNSGSFGFQQPGHDVRSTLQSACRLQYGYLPSSDNIGLDLWTGPQPPDQQFLDILSSPHQEFISTQKPVVCAPGSSSPTLTTTRSNTVTGGFRRLPPPSEERVDNEKISADNQSVVRSSNQTSPVVGRRRKGASSSFSVANRIPKRRTRVEGTTTLDIQKKALMNGVASPDRSLLLQSGSSSMRTTPTTEAHKLKPIEYVHSGEFFREASNIVLNDPKMTAIGVQYVQSDQPNDVALRWLRNFAMRGAEHDSADRDPPPRCHPGTRTTIIQKVQGWLENSEREKNLLWLRGTAGVGKSAIVQTVAETLSETGRLGASLFFSRPNGRNNPRQVFPTLAYQFAIQDPSYREYITQFVLTNPESLNKAMSEQFRILIVEPFVRKGIRGGTEPWVVTLDGLDECGEDPNGRRHSSDVQREVVHLISDFVQQYPSAPLIWIIASRPEVHLKAVFSELDVVPSLWEEDVPVDSDEACEDVQKFLHKEFTKIGRKYPEHILNSPWPTHKQFLKVAHAALGLFIFAEVVVRFVGDPEVGNPIGQLECVLLAISKMRSKNRENPLANLDVIYLAILSKIPPDALQTTKRLLGLLIHLNRMGVNISDCNFRYMCQILDISKDIGVAALRHLHSVLYFPKVKDLDNSRPRFYHASFRDFLGDESRSHEYFIDKALPIDQFAQGLARVAQTQFASDPDSPLSPLSSENRPDDTISDFVGCIFGYFSSDGVRFFWGSLWSSPSLPDAQLQSLLESLSVIKILKYTKHTLLNSFTEHNEYELSQRGFLFCMTFRSLSLCINWDTASMSISNLGATQHVQVDTRSGTESELSGDLPQVQEFRRRSKAAAPDEKVRVWGHRKSGCRVAVVTLENNYYALTGIPSVTT